jgi:hypothetical protein
VILLVVFVDDFRSFNRSRHIIGVVIVIFVNTFLDRTRFVVQHEHVWPTRIAYIRTEIVVSSDDQ